METPEQCVKPVYSMLTKRHPNKVNDTVLVSLLLTLKISHALLWCFHCIFSKTAGIFLIPAGIILETKI